MARGQYKRKDAVVKVMPDLTDQERAYVHELIAGATYSEAWDRAFDPHGDAKDAETGKLLTAQQRKTRARALLKKRRIRQWVEYIERATPDELIENVYVQQIAFGAPKEQLTAANAFLESQFAGKEVAEIFIRTLQQIQAQIVVPCKGAADKVSV